MRIAAVVPGNVISLLERCSERDRSSVGDDGADRSRQRTPSRPNSPAAHGRTIHWVNLRARRDITWVELLVSLCQVRTVG
jgi:hypothetical protein